MKKLLNKKGFTIVELVIVIAVIAILAAVLIPTFSNVIQSANDTAAMSEAESTLKAYVGYMGTNKQTLSDGPVFKVDDYSFVYYKGQLHQFDSKSEYTVGGELTVNPRSAELGPVIKVGDTYYACNKYFTTFIKDNKNEEPSVSSYKFATFFYVDNKIITFDNGSEKCKIYPGVVVYHNEESLATEANAPTSNYAKMSKGKQIKVVIAQSVSSPVEAESFITVDSQNKSLNRTLKVKSLTKLTFKINNEEPAKAIISTEPDEDGYVEFTFDSTDEIELDTLIITAAK